MPEYRLAGGSQDGPVSPDAWKRAVYKRPPRNFHVKLLPPEKHGNTYHYGLRIYPIKDDDASITTRTTSSGGSISSLNEYDIWRKWEDCLWWQDALEMEYSRAAREKRNRLAAGKGIKKNGVYIHGDQAASWESLPFGPNPNAIARDIHDHIPKLSKKATFFRVSQETVHNRYDELIAMMGALFDDELPTLIKEIKTTSTFKDFFGLWRRDIDLTQKAASPKKSTPDQPRRSLSASILSTLPTSATTASLSSKLSSPNKGKALEKVQIPFTHSDSSSDDSADPQRPSRLMGRGRQIHPSRSRASSSESRSSSPLPSTPVAPSPLTSRQPAMASQDTPVRFGHNPHVGERNPYSLQSLPEDHEFPSSSKSDLDELYSQKRPEPSARMVNRNAKVYVPSGSMESFEQPSVSPPQSLSHYSRISYQSRHSSVDLRTSAYLDELDVDYCLPSPTPMPRGNSRTSVCTVASVVTNASVDAVIPRNDWPSRSFANNARRPASLMEEPEDEVWSEYELQLEDQGDLLDTYFCDLIAPHDPTAQDYPETPMTYRFSQSQSIAMATSYARYSDRPSSLSSRSTLASGNPGVLSIKAMHEDHIVMLRFPHYITFKDLRRKIYDKFTQTERPAISESFAIALWEQPLADTVSMQTGRPRAGSCSTVGSAPAKGTALHFISSQDEWDDVVATHRGKIVLRIIGSRE